MIRGILLAAVLLLSAGCVDPPQETATTDNVDSTPAATESTSTPSETLTPAETASAPASTSPGSWSGNIVNFSYASADGEQFVAEEKFAGKPLVVNFWAAW